MPKINRKNCQNLQNMDTLHSTSTTSLTDSFEKLAVPAKLEEDEEKQEKARWDWNEEHDTRMENLLQTGFLSDITLEVGEERKLVKAHRLFLQAGSPELHRKLQTLDKNPDAVLSIPGVDYDSFLLFLNFLYTGDTGSDLEELSFLPLLKIATDYQVSTLAAICANKAERSLSEENVLSIYQQAMDCQHRPLINNSLIFICKHAWKIVDTDGFDELRQECLYEILKRDDLQVKSELHLFEAVLRWAHAECARTGREPGDWDNIRAILSKVIELIRFPVMDQAEFTVHVALKNFLSLEELVKILLYFTVPIAEREKIPPGRFISTPRQYYKGQGTKASASPKVPVPVRGLPGTPDVSPDDSDESPILQDVTDECQSNGKAQIPSSSAKIVLPRNEQELPQPAIVKRNTKQEKRHLFQI